MLSTTTEEIVVRYPILFQHGTRQVQTALLRNRKADKEDVRYEQNCCLPQENTAAAATAMDSGTCGELIQGVLDGCDFLVTSPINRFSTARVNLTTQSGIITSNSRPLWKAVSALKKTLEFFHVTEIGARLEIESELLPGKGCASSTADIAATVIAGASALGYEIRPDEIAKIALSVEPSDGIFWPGIVLFDHVRGNLFEFFGEPPPLNILIVDPDGVVDTVYEFDREKSRAVARANERQIKRAVELVREGIQRQEPWLIGQGATISARCNQQVLYKPELEVLIKLAVNMDAVGVNVAHSGTVLGVLFEPHRVNLEKLKKNVLNTLGESVKLDCASLISGGTKIVDEVTPGRYLESGNPTA